MESKFNFSEEDNLQNYSNNEKRQFNFVGFIYSFLKETLDFRDSADKESTLNSIKEDISIKGATWSYNNNKHRKCFQRGYSNNQMIYQNAYKLY